MLIPIIGWFSGIGLVIFLTVVVAELLPATVVIEKRMGLEPISRAWNLARRRFWWLLGFAFVFFIFNLLVVYGPVILLSSVLNVVISIGTEHGTVIGSLISNVIGSLLQILVLPVQLTAWTLIYFDLRVRTEGFDLALSTLETPEGEAIDISRLPVPASQQKWLTTDDIVKFVAISLGLLGIIALIVGIFAIIIAMMASVF
jgi:hypothetical protein